MEVAMVLKEIEMTPGMIVCVVRLAGDIKIIQKGASRRKVKANVQLLVARFTNLKINRNTCQGPISPKAISNNFLLFMVANIIQKSRLPM
jgi:hypothetical protein